MHAITREPTDTAADRTQSRTALAAFSLLLVVAGAGLLLVGGSPRWPTGLPRWDQLPALLAGTVVPLEPLAVLLVDLAWLVWLWMAASLGVELLLVAADSVAHGAAWVGSMRRIANRLTLPLARRAVAAAFAVQMLSRTVPLAHAAPLPAAELAVVAAAPSATTAVTASNVFDDSDSPAAAAYVVEAGDTLWSIAERAYGSGTAYRRVVEANLGRRMPDGQIFDARGVIRPGWQLVIPPRSLLVEDAGGIRWYTVARGDSLSAVAADVLGDESRWRELFDLNHGVMTDDGLHALTDPQVIWPGLRLQLPPAAEPLALADLTETPPAAAEPAATELVVASAVPPTIAAAPPPVVDASADLGLLPPVDLDSAPPLPVDLESMPPLLRTPHALDPIALDSPDRAASDLDSGGASADASEGAPGQPSAAEVPVASLAVAGASLAGIAGAVLVGATRIRRLRRLSGEPESDVVVEGGFAEAQLAHEFSPGRLDALDPVLAIVGRLQRFLTEYNLARLRVVAVRHGRSATALTIAAGLADQALLVDLAPVFAAELNAEIDAWVSADQDVVLRLRLPRQTRLLASAEGAPGEAGSLVPVGVAYDRQVVSAAWDSMGHVLVASQPGHGADTILTSLLASLTARCSPARLRLWLVARPHALAAPLQSLPHVELQIDPEDAAAVAGLADRLRSDPARHADSDAQLVIVVPELTSLGDHASSFELLAARGLDTRVRLIAATTQPDHALLSPLLSHFNTRMVLRMPNEETSVGVLGVADAVFLGGGGRLLLRLDGREPVELYGYQVAADHLERLARVMRAAYASREDASYLPGTPASAAPAADPADETPSAFDPDSASQVQLEPGQPGVEQNLPSLAPAPPPRDRVAIQPPTVSPIEIVCFGGPRVLCANQQIWPRLSAGEAKPWEFLLYLACQPAEGVSSDQAVEALWPEDDADNAAHRFRQLRYRLRQALAQVPGAPASDGICLERRRLRLDPNVIHSDATEFLGLVRSARVMTGADAIPLLERARGLYLGDLLEGPDARRYAWVDERDESGVTLREHFRRQFQQASTRLAELYATAGGREEAVEIYRELSAIDPGDERLWRALFRLHAERADRIALMREEHRMRTMLRELSGEDDAAGAAFDEPSRETVLEYERLLGHVRDAEREPARV